MAAELTSAQQKLLAAVREIAADPLRKGKTARQVLTNLRSLDHEPDEAGDLGSTLAQRWGLTEAQVDELLQRLVDEPTPPSAPTSPAPAGPRPEKPMPPTAASWNATCIRRSEPTCIHSWAAGYIHAPGDLCRGCTRHLMDLVQAGVPDVSWVDGWYRRAGVEAAVEAGGSR